MFFYCVFLIGYWLWFIIFIVRSASFISYIISCFWSWSHHTALLVGSPSDRPKGTRDQNQKKPLGGFQPRTLAIHEQCPTTELNPLGEWSGILGARAPTDSANWMYSIVLADCLPSYHNSLLTKTRSHGTSPCIHGNDLWCLPTHQLIGLTYNTHGA